MSSVWATSVAVYLVGSVAVVVFGTCVIASYLVGLVRSSRSDLALLARSKLSKITVVVTLPEDLLVLCGF